MGSIGVAINEWSDRTRAWSTPPNRQVLVIPRRRRCAKYLPDLKEARFEQPPFYKPAPHADTASDRSYGALAVDASKSSLDCGRSSLSRRKILQQPAVPSCLDTEYAGAIERQVGLSLPSGRNGRCGRDKSARCSSPRPTQSSRRVPRRSARQRSRSELLRDSSKKAAPRAELWRADANAGTVAQGIGLIECVHDVEPDRQALERAWSIEILRDSQVCRNV